MSDPAWLALEDGSVWEGVSCGAPATRAGEVVFNTSLTGYQEVLTDPSYCGQIVTMTSVHIGNTGINPEDMESARPFVEGFVLRESSPVASNWRSKETLEEFLRRSGVPAIAGIDTRALTRRLRSQGVMRGVITTDPLLRDTLSDRAANSPRLGEQDLVGKVTCPKPHTWEDPSPSALFHSFDIQAPSGARPHVAAIDLGIKWNILRSLAHSGVRLTVFPATATSRQILEARPDGLFLSNGPGDPERATDAIRAVRDLLGKVPVFGICLGHQILGLACGARTYKLKFGHRGSNHPVQRLADGRVEITTQNHGYAVDPGTAEAVGFSVTHRNLNDGTVEGLRHKSLPAFSVQY
ncbi:MAG: glutamine-hydrolyzing carbamoyl-phosphate synthase small subunit, partial [Planctomycetes bacterium]|nr:glutamine-hydrolyzing carbamoyl-phosphate synthase small subunit [Planctomycetota bacterium]